jgi:hypothetical protein
VDHGFGLDGVGRSDHWSRVRGSSGVEAAHTKDNGGPGHHTAYMACARNTTWFYQLEHQPPPPTPTVCPSTEQLPTHWRYYCVPGPLPINFQRGSIDMCGVWLRGLLVRCWWLADERLGTCTRSADICKPRRRNWLSCDPRAAAARPSFRSRRRPAVGSSSGPEKEGLGL